MIHKSRFTTNINYEFSEHFYVQWLSLQYIDLKYKIYDNRTYKLSTNL